ncbi:dihydrofolate reductase family protein [Kocuria sp. CH-021]|uniref:dihydrofolate reductase family protein n=1 Tax=Kocuria sp. CH-021 TaxID=3406735 RepID=UPI003C77CF90
MMEGEQPLGHRPRQGSPCRGVVGGGDLAAQFAEAGLLDQLMVSIAPVTLGAGRPLFPRRFDLELTDVARNRAFVCATYRVVGPMAPSGGGPTS